VKLPKIKLQTVKLPPMKWERTRYFEGMPCPKYMGYAYRDFNRDVIVYWTVPINLIIGAWRWFIQRVRFGFANGLEFHVSTAILRERNRCIGIVEKHYISNADPRYIDALEQAMNEIAGPRK